MMSVRSVNLESCRRTPGCVAYVPVNAMEDERDIRYFLFRSVREKRQADLNRHIRGSRPQRKKVCESAVSVLFCNEGE